jgi:hypothetical protein
MLKLIHRRQFLQDSAVMPVRWHAGAPPLGSDANHKIIVGLIAWRMGMNHFATWPAEDIKVAEACDPTRADGGGGNEVEKSLGRRR